MGLNEPIDHWAPPDSLDPTPVWRQYLLVVLLGAGIFVFGAFYAYVAFLPDLVTPPAALPGRVVLGALQYPPGTTQKVSIAGPDQTFYLTYAGTVPVAVRATWSSSVGGASQCQITLIAENPLMDYRVTSSSLRLERDRSAKSRFLCPLHRVSPQPL